MIEKAKLEDLEDIYELICILENKEINKQHFIGVFEEGIKSENIIFLVYRKERVLGFLSFYVHRFLHHHNDTGEIVELVVRPEYRGLRIGDRLINEIEKIANEMKLEQIELSTSTYRIKAHQFYENHGYEKGHYNYTKDL